MPKKKIIASEEVETTTEVETPIEVTIEAPTLSESEQIVEWNKELEQLKKDVAESRDNFVKQTDKQFAKIKELDETIASKQAKIDEYNSIIDSIPEAQKKLSDARNQATILISQAETSLKELEKREQTLAKATAKLAEQKAELDATNSAQEARSITLDVREKEIKERDKATDGLKKALGIK